MKWQRLLLVSLCVFVLALGANTALGQQNQNNGFKYLRGGRRSGGGWIACALAILSLLGVLGSGSSLAQSETATSLAERSAIVVRGTVVRLNASEEPLQQASANTFVIKVSHMYAGSEIAGDQTGRTVTIVASHPPRLKAGEEALFFGNPRFVGKSLTIVAEGELLSQAPSTSTAELEVGLQARRDRPVRDRVATASLIFRGKVEGEDPLVAAGEKKQLRVPPSEHDPEWHVASVRVITPLRGGDRDALVTIIFPASRDIMWFNSPKLRQGMDAIFITHKPDKEEAVLLRTTGVTAFMEKQPAELVTQPFDVLPASDEQRVRRLLAKEVR